MNIKRMLAHDERFILRTFTHQDIDKACFDAFGERPYRLGESKKSKLDKIRDYISENNL